MHAIAMTPHLAQLPPRHLARLRWNALDPRLVQCSGPRMAAEVTLNYQGVRLVGQQQKSWSGVSANIAEMRCDNTLCVDLSAASTRLSVVLEEVGGRFSVQSKGWRCQSPTHESPQPLSLIPADLQARGHGEGMRFFRHLVLQFDLAAVAGMMENDVDLTKAFAPRPSFREPGIMRLAQLLAEECATDKPNSQLYGDTLSMALLLALSRLGTSNHRSVKQGQLAPWQVRRVTEYLAAHLAEDIPLQTLSNLVRLSRSYFSRAFKLSTGLAPHRWLLQARVDKSKQLLLQADRPLAQIAVEVGFADQAHFTRTFRREVGESPGAWQRARRDGAPTRD